MTRNDPSQSVIETERLVLRHFAPCNASFVIELLNDPAFLEYIGDKGVRTEVDALRYIQGLVDGYTRLGFGLYLVVRRRDGERVGMCGLVRRDTLDDVDVGFAFLRQHWSRGYAFEAAEAVLAFAQVTLGFERIVAVVSPDNASSKRLLGKLGMRFERRLCLSADESEVELHGIVMGSPR